MAITTNTTFEETRNFQPPNLRPDFGFFGPASGAATLGAQESILLTGSHAALHALEGFSAKQRGEEPLTEEAHKELFGDSIPFVEGEFKNQAQLRSSYTTTRRRAEFKSQELGLVPQLGFGILGNSVDAPFMVVPGLAAAGKVKAFAHARKTGLSFKAAEEFIKRSNQGTTIKKAISGAATEQLVETQAVFSLSSYTGREYGAMDRVMDLAFGMGVTSGINIPLIAHSKKVARQQGRIISDLRAMEAYFEHGDYAEGLVKLSEFSESLGIGVSIDPETQAILSKEPDQRTPEDQAVVEAFLNRHMEAIEAENAKASVQMDPDKPIVEAKAEMDQNMQDALDKGSNNSPKNEFTQADSDQVITTADKFLQALGFDVRVRANKKEGSLAFYDGDINLDPELRPDWALPLVFHELVHHFAKTNKQVFDELSNVVERFRGDKVFLDKVFNPKQRQVYQEKFGDQFLDKNINLLSGADDATIKRGMEAMEDSVRSRLNEEETAWFMTEATRHPEFWQALKQRNPGVFEQFKLWLRSLWEAIVGNRRIDRATMTADQKLAMQQFGEILAAAESVDRQGALDDPSPTRRTQSANAAARKLDRDLAESNKKKADQVRERERAEHDTVIKEGSQDAGFGVMDSNTLQKKVVDFVTSFNTNTEGDYTTLRGEFLKELGLSEGQLSLGADVVNNVRNANQRLLSLQTQVLSFFEGDLPAQVLKNKRLFEDYKFFEFQASKGSLSVAEARSAYLKKAEEDFQNTVVSETKSLEAIIRIENKVSLQGGGKLGAIKFLKTLIDGRERKGVSTKDTSMEAKILAQIQEDQGALRHALVEHGLYDIFSGVSTVSSESLRNRSLQTVSSETGQQIYGKKLQEAHNLFWEDLLSGARRQEIPDNWKGVKPLEAVFDAYMATVSYQRNQLNAIGAGIRFRKGYSGLSHRWDDGAILRVGEEEWYRDMEQAVDWEATESAHGGVLTLKTDEDGAVIDFEPFTKEDFMAQWLFEIQNKEREVHSSEDISKSFGQHLKVVLKPEAELSMLNKYSGHTSPGILFMDQVRHRSEVIAVGNILGPRPLPNFDAIVSRLGLDPEMTVKEAVIGTDKVQNLSVTSLMWSIRHLTGSLDNPVNVDLAERSKTIRRLSNILFMPLSGVSAITDIPMIALRLNQQGVLKLEDMGSFMFKYYRAHKRNLGTDSAVREAFERDGAGLDAALNAASARIAIGDPNNPSVLSKANDIMFTVNYLNGITRAGQETYVDVLGQAIARQFDTRSLDALLQTALDAHGFTETDLTIIRDSVIEGVDGVRRVGPSSVADPKVSRKLREFFLQGMNEAVLFPDVGSQALLRMGTRSGTWAGEVVRTALQYSSFPLAMTRITMRKFMTTYQGTNAWTVHQTGMIQMTAFVGAMLAMGYMATVLKDILRGREPMSLNNMSAKGWGRVVAQSGVAGILEQVFDLGQGNVRGAIAPLPGTLLKAANSDSLAEVADDLRPFAGSSYPIIGPAASQVLATSFGESLQELQNQRRIALETMYQQNP